MSKTMALIQARMSSSRFPGKVIEPLAGVPMIVFMACRAQHARTLDQVAVVTSIDPSDDALASTVERAGLPVFRGSLKDVLARYGAAAEHFGVDEVVRLTGDCPLIDPATIDAVVAARREHRADYASNCEPPTFPDGLDTECFTRTALVRALGRAKLPSEREHVTLWMRSDEAKLKRVNVRALADFSALRLTVDYPDDLALVRELVTRIGPREPFDLFDVLRLLAADPALGRLNVHERNEGLAETLRKEEA